jgi:hypothetical protein
VNESEKPSLPLWLKLLAVVGVIGLISFAVLAVVAWQWLAKTVAFDDAGKAKIADSIVRIQKLPSGFQLVTAMTYQDLPMVMYQDRKARLQITVIKDRHDVYRDRSAETIMMLQRPTVAKIWLGQGQRKVAGEAMYYKLRRMPELQTAIMDGCIVPSTTKVPILFQGQTSFSASYDMDDTNRFLDAITGF